jgi:beta-glucanase (GH16 family)
LGYSTKDSEICLQDRRAICPPRRAIARATWCSTTGTTLDTYWHSYITSNAAGGYAWNSNGSGGSTEGGPYVANYDLGNEVSVNNGLSLTAIQQSVQGINQGVSQTFSVTSGAVSSYGAFEFDGGYLQVSMQQPSGDGSWPALWMLPGKGAGSSGDNFEIDMQEGGFLNGSDPAGNEGWHLHTPSGTFGGVTNVGTDLSVGFHTYGIDWQPGQSITWYLDGKQIGQVTSAQTAIPNEPMEVIMSNAVGTSASAGFHTALDGTTPYSMPMQIGDVQLYQHAGSGDTVTGANVTASSGTSTSGTGTTTGTTGGTVTAVAPVLTIAANALSVSPGPVGVPLGIGVSVPHAGDSVTVKIAGLPKYETITDNLDHKTFSGSSVSLTADEVNSGLTLNSSYRGHGHPTATLTVTATDNTGTPISSAAQTMTVVDPPPAIVAGRSGDASAGGATKPVTSAIDPGTSVTSATDPGTPVTPMTVADPGRPSGQALPNGHFDLTQWFDSHPGFAPVATTLGEFGASGLGAAPNPGAAADHRVAGAGDKAFAVFNQMMAGDFGGGSHFAQAAPASFGSPQSPDLLTRPLH